MNKPVSDSQLLSRSNSISVEERQKIEDFLNDYCYQLDDDNIEAWPKFFAEDSIYQLTTRQNYEADYPLGIILCEGLGMMEDRVRALRTANIYEEHTYCHLLGRPDIQITSRNTYQVRSNFTVHRTMCTGKAELFATGKYLDEIADEPSGLRFQERRVILDSRQIDTLLVIPL